jgi:hypothetical protein
VKAKLLLADSAASHPDGTISLLRMGITHAWGDALPVTYQGVLVIRIEATMVDEGEHDLQVRMMTFDGKEFAPRLQGKFTVPKGGGNVNVLLRFGIGFPKYETYTFAAVVDRTEQDRITLDVRPSKERPNASSPS